MLCRCKCYMLKKVQFNKSPQLELKDARSTEISAIVCDYDAEMDENAINIIPDV